VGGAVWDKGGAELSLRGVRDAATSAEIASAAPRNDNQGGSATGTLSVTEQARHLPAGAGTFGTAPMLSSPVWAQASSR
jgi:hypothetical protein